MYRFITFVLLVVLSILWSSFGVHVSDNDLHKFSERLLTLDSNNAGRYITLDLQKRIQFDTTTDEAPDKLIHFKKEVFSIPTVAKLIKLFDNYELNSLNNEVVTPEEKREESVLLDAILNTTVMAETKSFLQSHGLIPGNGLNFKRILSDIWFSLYSRGKSRIGSSAFEHIFMAELKNGAIAGLHNWVYFSHEEHLGHANYLGWQKRLDFPSKPGSGVVKLKYSWGSSLKHSNSLFVGTSPEIEMSLYTICFLVRPNDKCHITLNGKKLFIQTYEFKYNGKSFIGSAYPVI